jgi:uracil phosphoribosyltransferase
VASNELINRLGVGEVIDIEKKYIMVMQHPVTTEFGKNREYINETLEAVEYYCKLPTDVKERDLLVVDPMLATGNTAMEAIKFIKERDPRSIKLMVLVAAPEGIKKIQDAHPDIDIWTAALDEKLNDHAYIVPGLGDAGDRLYGTK